MTTTQDLPAVRAYLDDLRQALAARPADERELVLDGVRQHIEDALAGSADQDPAAVQRVLEELGDPAAIAAESGEPVARVAATPAVVPFLDRRSGVVVTALLVGVGGFLLPVLGWVVGLLLLWRSRSWRVRDKLVGTLLPFVLTAVLLGVAALLPESAVSFGHLAVLAGVLGGGIAAGAYLLVRARPRG